MIGCDWLDTLGLQSQEHHQEEAGGSQRTVAWSPVEGCPSHPVAVVVGAWHLRQIDEKLSGPDRTRCNLRSNPLSESAVGHRKSFLENRALQGWQLLAGP